MLGVAPGGGFKQLQLVWGAPPVDNFGNLFLERPLVTSFGYLAQVSPLLVNVDIMLGFAPGGGFHKFILGAPSGGQF